MALKFYVGISNGKKIKTKKLSISISKVYKSVADCMPVCRDLLNKLLCCNILSSHTPIYFTFFSLHYKRRAHRLALLYLGKYIEGNKSFILVNIYQLLKIYLLFQFVFVNCLSTYQFTLLTSTVITVRNICFSLTF